MCVRPLLHVVQRVVDDEGGEELRRPGLDRDAGLLVAAVNVPGSEEAGNVLEDEVEEVHEEPLHALLISFGGRKLDIVVSDLLGPQMRFVEFQGVGGRVTQNIEHEF